MLPRLAVDLAKIDPVHPYHARLRIEETGDEIDDGALSLARGAHDGDAFPLVEIQHRVLDDPTLARPVAERHPVEKESLPKRRRLAAGPGRRFCLHRVKVIPPTLVPGATGDGLEELGLDGGEPGRKAVENGEKDQRQTHGLPGNDQKDDKQQGHEHHRRGLEGESHARGLLADSLPLEAIGAGEALKPLFSVGPLPLAEQQLGAGDQFRGRRPQILGNGGGRAAGLPAALQKAQIKRHGHEPE